MKDTVKIELSIDPVIMRKIEIVARSEGKNAVDFVADFFSKMGGHTAGNSSSLSKV